MIPAVAGECQAGLLGKRRREPGVLRTGEEALTPQTSWLSEACREIRCLKWEHETQSSGHFTGLHTGSSSQSWDQNPGSPSYSLKVEIIAVVVHPTHSPPKSDSQLPYVSLLL